MESHQLERKALYTLMRMNWLLDPSMPAEPWQVEDYRALPTGELFQRLEAHDISLSKESFLAFADEAADPEELTALMLVDGESTVVAHDQVYLLLFELWRRLVNDRPSLAIFCDELDQQIYYYDHDPDEHAESIQDSIANLLVLMDENADQGVSNREIFQAICHHCANDLESFLYDYILDQIDSGQGAYAHELIDNAIDYVGEPKWFNLLRVHLLALSDPAAVPGLVERLYALYGSEHDLDFDLELLTLLADGAQASLFVVIFKDAIPLLRAEESFQDLLSIAIDFFAHNSNERAAAEARHLLKKRADFDLAAPFQVSSPAVKQLLALFP